MSRIVYRLWLGRWRIGKFEIEADTPEPDDDYDDCDDELEISGGSAHNFERDGAPLTPDDRYRYEWDGFGFQP